MSFSSELSYCVDLVRRQDYDSYLCLLCAPREVRDTWFALFAFNCEIAAIEGKVSEALLGQMRFAWWREALEEIFSGQNPRKHPVVEALATAVGQHTLPRAPLDQVLNAHEAREDLKDEEFCRDTYGALFALCVQNEAAEALGTAWGLIRLAHYSQNVPHAFIENYLQQSQIPPGLESFHAAALFYAGRLRKNNTKPSRVLLPLMLTLKAY